ncbi:MAG: hypothetical protein GXO43_06080 [Crenarchaeota archaeon]|nr:hypothetical protein [Thermoproteota archaeon]
MNRHKLCVIAGITLFCFSITMYFYLYHLYHNVYLCDACLYTCGGCDFNDYTPPICKVYAVLMFMLVLMLPVGIALIPNMKKEKENRCEDYSDYWGE